MYEPGEYLVIDESMVPWRGRLVFCQYMPGKRHKYGIKIFKLCTPEGYTSNILIYSGKESCPQNATTYDFGVAGQYVISLANSYLNQGRTLYMDNWYTSIPLAQELLDRNTACTETIEEDCQVLL